MFSWAVSYSCMLVWMVIHLVGSSITLWGPTLSSSGPSTIVFIPVVTTRGTFHHALILWSCAYTSFSGFSCCIILLWLKKISEYQSFFFILMCIEFINFYLSINSIPNSMEWIRYVQPLKSPIHILNSCPVCVFYLVKIFYTAFFTWHGDILSTRKKSSLCMTSK